MGDIGTTLREERVRRGIGIDAVEADTKIRARYLLALEEGRFDALPGTAYARAFLRGYAERLGLDAQALVDRLNAEAGLADDVAVAPARPTPSGPILGRRRGLVALAGAGVAVAVAGVAAWALLGSSSGPPASTGSGPPPPQAFVTRLHAGPGPTRLLVRQGPGAGGRVLYRGVLAAGAGLSFRRHPLWMRVGTPRNLRVTVAGHALHLPRGAGDVLVTRRAIRRVA
jgi:Helix-turn-helix domain